MKKLIVSTVSMLLAGVLSFTVGCASSPPADPSVEDGEEDTAQPARSDYGDEDSQGQRRPSSPGGLGFPGGDPSLSPVPFP